MLSMYQGIPYIAFKGILRGRIRAISRHMEGQESYESDPSQGTLQKDFGLCTHPDVRNYRGNIRVCTWLSGKMPHISSFLMFLGMVDDTSKDK